MTEKSPNLVFKYAIFGSIAGLCGAFISQYLGYNDGNLAAYLSAAFAGCVGGAIGGNIRKKKGKTN
jgi:H+/Cl- antiporter ClcA